MIVKQYANAVKEKLKNKIALIITLIGIQVCDKQK